MSVKNSSVNAMHKSKHTHTLTHADCLFPEISFHFLRKAEVAHLQTQGCTNWGNSAIKIKARFCLLFLQHAAPAVYVKE